MNTMTARSAAVFHRHRLALLLGVFVLSGTLFYSEAPGDDLAPTFIGCRLLAQGQGDELYSHDSNRFDRVESDAWRAQALAAHIRAPVHPYVQTPLWVFMLQPLCTAVTFATFKIIFVVLALAALAGMLWLVARYWASYFMRPLWMTLSAVAIALSMPFQYALWLVQTHPIFMFFTLAALVLAQRRRPIAAGCLLAIAASVKLTPALIVIYWLARREVKPVLAFVAFSALIALATVMVSGWDLTRAYLAEIHRIADVLLVSFNNQSFAAWWHASAYPAQDLFRWQMLPLPLTTQLVSGALCFSFLVVGGVLDRRAEHAPVGAALSLVAIVVFTPIAWTHYFIVLAVPAMLLAHQAKAQRLHWLWPALLAIAFLNLQPLAIDPIEPPGASFAITRGHFLSAIATIALLLAVATTLYRRRRSAD